MGVKRWTSLSWLRCLWSYVRYAVRYTARTLIRCLLRHGWRCVTRLLSISLLCSVFLLQGSYVYAEDELKPVEYVEAYEEKVSPDEIIAMRGDGYVKANVSQLRSSGDDEGGDDSGGSVISGVSASVFSWVIENAITNHESELSIMDDLAWRYYNADPVMRDNIPVVPTGNAKPLSDFDNWGDWNSYCRSNYTYNVPYRLVGLSDGKSWDSTSPNAEIEYGRWYDYYNGTTPDSGGSGTGGQAGKPTGSITLVGVYGKRVISGENVDIVGQTVAGTISTNSQNAIDTWYTNGYTNWLTLVINSSSSYGSTSHYYYYMSQNPIEYTVNGTDYITVSVTSSSVIRGNDASIGYLNSSTQFNYGFSSLGSKSISINLNSRYNIGLYVASNTGGGSVPTPEPDPVYTPTGGKPDSTNIINSPTYNSPTYSNNNYQVTQTDVDLQPVIDAINVVNENLSELDHNLQVGFGDIHDILQGWQDTWVESMAALHGDITNYLWRIERYLESILGMMHDDEILPEPTYDGTNTPQQQATVNMNLLKNKFPFSLPWDAYAILSLLEAPPTPIYFVFPVIMTEYTITVDCSPLAPMAAVSRSMSLVLFAAGLLMATKNFLIVINTAISE